MSTKEAHDRELPGITESIQPTLPVFISPMRTVRLWSHLATKWQKSETNYVTWYHTVLKEECGLEREILNSNRSNGARGPQAKLQYTVAIPIS